MMTMTDERYVRLRKHRSNIGRYCSLLKTQLMSFEREFIERRLSEEWWAMECLASSTFPRRFELRRGLKEPQPKSAMIDRTRSTDNPLNDESCRWRS
jgi:hypothetical protein